MYFADYPPNEPKISEQDRVMLNKLYHRLRKIVSNSNIIMITAKERRDRDLVAGVDNDISWVYTEKPKQSTSFQVFTRVKARK